MKITIDTKLDSKEEIKKAIRLLTSLVGHAYEQEHTPQPLFTNAPPPSAPNIFEQNTPSVGNLMSLFDSAEPKLEQAPPQEEPSADIPQIEFY